MRQIIVLAVIIAVVAGAAVPSKYWITKHHYHSPTEVLNLRIDVDNIGLGNYRYDNKQIDGTRQEQEGEFTNEGPEEEAIVVKVSFSWVAPNGVRYTVTYTSGDEDYNPVQEGPGSLPYDPLCSCLGG